MAVIQGVRLVCACGLFAAAVSVAAAQSVDSGTNMEMSVQVSVTNEVLDKDGNQVLPVSVPTVFRVARTRHSAGWQTVVTYRKHAGAPTRSSSHPLDGARVEFDEASGTTRVYNSAGELNPLLSTDSTGGLQGALGPGQWLDGLIARDNEQPKRSMRAAGEVRQASRSGPWAGTLSHASRRDRGGGAGRFPLRIAPRDQHRPRRDPRESHRVRLRTAC